MSYSESEIEKIIKNVKANMYIENLDMTEEELENCRCVLRGEKTADEIVKNYIRKLFSGI